MIKVPSRLPPLSQTTGVFFLRNIGTKDDKWGIARHHLNMVKCNRVLDITQQIVVLIVRGKKQQQQLLQQQQER